MKQVFSSFLSWMTALDFYTPKRRKYCYHLFCNCNKDWDKKLNNYLLALFSPHLFVCLLQTSEHRHMVLFFIFEIVFETTFWHLGRMEAEKISRISYHKRNSLSSITGEANECSGSKDTAFSHFSGEQNTVRSTEMYKIRTWHRFCFLWRVKEWTICFHTYCLLSHLAWVYVSDWSCNLNWKWLQLHKHWNLPMQNTLLEWDPTKIVTNELIVFLLYMSIYIRWDKYYFKRN